jgi:hypothetical protein
MVRQENLGNAPADDQQEQAPVPSFNDLEQPVTQSTNTVPFFRPPFYQPTFGTPGQSVGNPPPNQQQPLNPNPNEPPYQPTFDYPDQGVDGNFTHFQQQQQQPLNTSQPSYQPTFNTPGQGIRPLNPHQPLSTTDFPAGLGQTRMPAVDPSRIMMSGDRPTREANINPEMKFADPWQTPTGETHKPGRMSRGISPKTTIPLA